MPLKDLLFGFKGRIRRRDWWLAAIGVGLIHSLLANVLTPIVLCPAAYSMSDAFAGVLPVFDPRQTAIMIAIALPFLWPSLALATKRAHDRDQSGRLTVGVLIAAWIISFLPGSAYEFIYGLRGIETPLDVGALVLGISVLLAKIWLFVVLGLLDGTRGPNRYGPSPKGEERPPIIEPGGTE